jgi:hypothetical protein
VQPFELSAIGGPWAKRLANRRGWIDELPWDEPLPDADEASAARLVWTRTSFSEYASAAAFAEIAAAMLRTAAPIDLVAAAGEFVVEELLHTEVAARLALALGGATPLLVDFDKLVRPPAATSPLLRAAELVVRTSCVGESLTVPMLKLSRHLAGSQLVAGAIHRIVADESGHAQFGWWFLDWADTKLSDADRAYLARIAGGAIEAFAPLFEREWSNDSGLGVVACDRYEPAFVAAVTDQVVQPLFDRGIVVHDTALAFMHGSTRSVPDSDR